MQSGKSSYLGTLLRPFYFIYSQIENFFPHGFFPFNSQYFFFSFLKCSSLFLSPSIAVHYLLILYLKAEFSCEASLRAHTPASCLPNLRQGENLFLDLTHSKFLPDTLHLALQWLQGSFTTFICEDPHFIREAMKPTSLGVIKTRRVIFLSEMVQVTLAQKIWKNTRQVKKLFLASWCIMRC